MLILEFKFIGFQKAKKHTLSNSNNLAVSNCLEESSPKLPRQSPGAQSKDLLRWVF